MNDEIILVTGSAGLIGRALVPRLEQFGAQVFRFDLREVDVAWRNDISDRHAISQAVNEVTGIVHLAGVSRVIEGELHPDRCQTLNVEATAQILKLAANASKRPWVLYASSREVYRQQDDFPVSESAQLRPMNVYARSKVAAELAIEDAQKLGLKASILRFSSVYGDTSDHSDRVAPAFARAAARGGELRIDGSGHTFDFTYIDDVADGILRAVNCMAKRGEPLPPIHLTSGVATSLSELATIAISAAGNGARSYESAPRPFDVQRFQGDPARAADLLGWRTRTSVADGMARLIAKFKI